MQGQCSSHFSIRLAVKQHSDKLLQNPKDFTTQAVSCPRCIKKKAVKEYPRCSRKKQLKSVPDVSVNWQLNSIIYECFVTCVNS